jgi:hypothetical protein
MGGLLVDVCCHVGAMKWDCRIHYFGGFLPMAFRMCLCDDGEV